MEVGTFDCETETSSTDLCRALGVDRYPSIYFIGYGDFNQGRQGNLLQKTELPRVVKYTADLYPDRIYDWMLMLNKISIIQRGVDNLKGTFTMKHGIHARVVELEEEVVKSDTKCDYMRMSWKGTRRMNSFKDSATTATHSPCWQKLTHPTRKRFHSVSA